MYYYGTLRIVHSIQNRVETGKRRETLQYSTPIYQYDRKKCCIAQRDGLFSAVILFCYLPERRHSTTHLVCRPILFLLISTSQDLFTTGHALESSTIEEDYYYYSSYNYRLHSYCFVYVVTENTELRKLGITICMDFSQTRFPQYTFSPLGDSATKAVCS